MKRNKSNTKPVTWNRPCNSNCNHHWRPRRLPLDQCQINQCNNHPGWNKFKETNHTLKRSNTKGIPQILGCLLWEKCSTIPWTPVLGPQNWTKGHICPKILQNVQSNPNGTNQIRQFSERKPGQGIHPTIVIPNGFTLLLCQQKGWKVTTMPRLPIPKQTYGKKCIPTSIDKWIVGQTQRSKTFHQTWCMMGV